jgi:hypothetical protein
VGWVDVTCEEAGVFELTAASQIFPHLTETIEVTCVGEVDDILLTATPNKIEIVPAAGSVAYSLIVAELVDEDGNPVLEGPTVDFVTDRCEFLDEDGLSEAAFLELADLFADYDVNDLSTAEDITQAIEDLLDDGTLEDDPDDVSNPVASFTLDDDAGDFAADDTIAAILLDCSGTGNTPGIAEVTAEVDQPGANIMVSTEVTVVGPPHTVSVSADAEMVKCGDRATITVEVKDAAGQHVSDHTLVEAVTNFGGVLGGTGAVVGNFGFVVPVSSTVAETFAGKATFFLITSETHEGAYDVTVATGGGGSVSGQNLGGLFSTPVVTGHVSVECEDEKADHDKPDVVAPNTGGGIIPPSTGDAGLAAGSGSSAMLFVIAGAVAFVLAGAATFGFARR